MINTHIRVVEYQIIHLCSVHLSISSAQVCINYRTGNITRPRLAADLKFVRKAPQCCTVSMLSHSFSHLFHSWTYLSFQGWHTAASLTAAATEGNKEKAERFMYFDHTTQYHQKHASYSSGVSDPRPTLGGYFTAPGIITSDPFPKKTRVCMSMTSLPVAQLNTHAGNCLIHDANRSWDNRVWRRECFRIHSTKVK